MGLLDTIYIVDEGVYLFFFFGFILEIYLKFFNEQQHLSNILITLNKYISIQYVLSVVDLRVFVLIVCLARFLNYTKSIPDLNN